MSEKLSSQREQEKFLIMTPEKQENINKQYESLIELSNIDKTETTEHRRNAISSAYQEVNDIYKQTTDLEKSKPIEDMSIREIGDEYLDLLKKLSSDFVKSDDKGRFSPLDTFLYSDMDSKDREYISNKINEFNQADRSALSFADQIIHGEALWRASDEKARQVDLCNSELQQLKQEYKSKNIFKRLISIPSYREQKKEILKKQSQPAVIGFSFGVDNINHVGNNLLQTNLYKAYSDNYKYTQGDYSEDKELNNENYNQKFFNEDKQADIDRAVDLYKKLSGNFTDLEK